jgi:transcriptional regulator with XRE-family HTH domain
MGPNSPDSREDGLRELREIRLRRGLSQADLSALTGVAEFTISEIESGKRANPRPSTLRKLAEALKVEVADLYGEVDSPLGQAPPSPEQPNFNGLLEEERRLRYLQGFRAFVNRLAHSWEDDPPKTSREIAPLFAALTAVVEQGVFDPPEGISPFEGEQLMQLTIGFQRLNDIANKVEQDEERDAVVRDIREKFSA